MRKLVKIPIIAAGAILALGVGYFGAARLFGPKPSPSPATTSTVRVFGSIELGLGQFVWDANPDRCEGWKGYDDLKVGTQVVVTDPSGTTIAIGRLEEGKPTRNPVDPARANSCTLTFAVNAPAGHQFYGIEVAHRGRLQYEVSRLQYAINLGF